MAPALLSLMSDRKKLKAWHQKTLNQVLNERGIPDVSPAMAAHAESGATTLPGRGGQGRNSKRRKINIEGEDSSSEGEAGLELNMEHDSWSCPMDEGCVSFFLSLYYFVVYYYLVLLCGGAWPACPTVICRWRVRNSTPL